MNFNFKKNIVIGVSINPEVGLEVAQIDFAAKSVLKYGCKQLAYDYARKEIADLDIFKESLLDLFIELQIPKGSDVVINIPTVHFKISDYPASLNEGEISTAIEEDLTNHPIFQNNEPCISAVLLPNSTIQFNKIACTVAQKIMLIEIAMQIKELGYNLIAIDTSVNSTLNALIYNERVDVSPDKNWVMLLIENNCCRILSMQGRNYVDSFEEHISIGEVLGDAENYSILSGAVNPILKNIPSQLLYVVSKTNLISAKALADKLDYNAPIIHQEANIYTDEAFLEYSPEIDAQLAKNISLDVIGAGILRDFGEDSTARFNLFNASLGDIYTSEQPPVIKYGSISLTLSITNMVVLSIALALIIIVIDLFSIIPLNQIISRKKDEIAQYSKDIASIQKYLNEHKNISTEMFDEGDEIRIGLFHNKNIYTYYTIVGTEIPKKLWLTKLELGNYITIEGQADNLESVYSFFRNIKDYNPTTDIKLQKLGLATSSKINTLTEEQAFDTDSIITSMNADFYEFRISNAPEISKTDVSNADGDKSNLLNLEPLE